MLDILWYNGSVETVQPRGFCVTAQTLPGSSAYPWVGGQSAHHYAWTQRPLANRLDTGSTHDDGRFAISAEGQMSRFNPRTCGIYAFIHDARRLAYVGQTSNSTTSRRTQHIKMLTVGAHSSQPFQHAWTDTGGAGWEFRVLERPPADLERDDIPSWLNAREYFWHNAYAAMGYAQLSGIQSIRRDWLQYRLTSVSLPEYLHDALEEYADALGWPKARLLSEYIVQTLTVKRLEDFVNEQIARRAREFRIEDGIQ